MRKLIHKHTYNLQKH